MELKSGQFNWELHVYTEKFPLFCRETLRISDIDVLITINKLNGRWEAVFEYRQLNDNSAKYLHAPGIECEPVLPILNYCCVIHGGEKILPPVISPLEWVVNQPGKII